MAGRGVEAYEVYPSLFIGPKPPTGTTLAKAGFRVLALCAHENQPGPEDFPGVAVLQCPMDDNPFVGLSKQDAETAVVAAKALARGVRDGRPTLVTCQAGIDRSALVAGMIMWLLTGWSGDRIVATLRDRRPMALSLNAGMRKALQALPARTRR